MNKATKLGDTPLSIAKSEGNYKIVELLKERVVALLRVEIRSTVNEIQACIICMNDKPEVILVPCGHHNFCGGCAYQWREEQKGCPMDRMRITDIIPLKPEK